jgi:hypothetical protein
MAGFQDWIDNRFPMGPFTTPVCEKEPPFYV